MPSRNHSASACHSTAGNGIAFGEGNQSPAWRRAFNEAIEVDPSVAMPRGNHAPPPSAVGNGNAPAQGSQPPVSTIPFSVLTDGGSISWCTFCNCSISARPVNQSTPSFPSSNGPAPHVEFLRYLLLLCDSNKRNSELFTRSSPSPSAVGNGNAPAQGSQPPASIIPFSVTDGGNIWRCRLCDFSINMRPVNQETPFFPSSNGPAPDDEFLECLLPPCDSNEGNLEPSPRSSLQGRSGSRLSS